MKTDKVGFTLVELLVVISLFSVLSTATFLVINPAELIRQVRDSVRVNDVHAMERAIGMVKAGGEVTYFGSPTIIYTSLPDNSPTCANLHLPNPPSGFTWGCVSSSTLRKTDGTGWIPVNFVLFSGGSPFSKLPVDPENTTSSGKFYIYIANADASQWTISAPLTSARYASSTGATDNGYSNNRLEIGSDLSFASSVVAVFNTNSGGGTLQMGGPNFPHSATNDDTIEGEEWSNIENILVNDTQRATSHDVDTEYAKATDFRFSIPANAIINGIEVEIKKKANGDSESHYNVDNSVKIIKSNGSFGVLDKADITTHWPSVDTNYVVYGSPTDLWGETWTPSDINNSNFGAAISARGVGNSGNDVRYWINNIRITVYYSN